MRFEWSLASLTVFEQVHAAQRARFPGRGFELVLLTSRTAEGGWVVSKTVHEDGRKMWGAAAHFNWKPV